MPAADRPLRVFLLAWEGLMYAWALLYSPAMLERSTLCLQLSPPRCPAARYLTLLQDQRGSVAAFTTLMLLH